MISMSYKSPSVDFLFTKSLESRLRYLTASANSQMDNIDYEGGHWLDRQLNVEQDNQEQFPYQGTTFPPRNFSPNIDQRPTKYHSESDLINNSLVKLKQKNNEKIFNPNQSTMIQEEATIKSYPNDGDKETDSDLFFDFDIDDKKDNDKEDELNAFNESLSDMSKLSTGYGSLASELFTDEHETEDNCDFGRGKENIGSLSSTVSSLSIETQSPNDTPQTQDSIMLASAFSVLEDPKPMNGFQITSNNNDRGIEIGCLQQESRRSNQTKTINPDSKVSSSISVFSGNLTHHIAHSKLNALISSLERDREYARQSFSSASSSTSSSNLTTKENTPVRDVVVTKKSLKISHMTNKTFAVGSPINFSFLTSANGQKNNREKLERCSSTPVLTANEREFISSPRFQRKLSNTNKVPVSNNIKTDNENPKIITKDDNDDDDDEEEMPKTIRRASSLKTGKTPPGSDRRRKIVRFADVFGLELTDVKTFLDEVPKIPKSAYNDLNVDDLVSSDDSDNEISTFSFLSKPSSSHTASNVLSNNINTLVPMFSQPGVFPDFFDIIHQRKVCLENAYMVDTSCLRGTIRVQNLSFHKNVFLRYTTNEWITYEDLPASYLPGSCDGFSDKFSFNLTVTAPLLVGQRIQFCIKYQANGDEFWDSNNNNNYIFQCLSQNSGPSSHTNTTTPTTKSSSSTNQLSVPSLIPKPNNLANFQPHHRRNEAYGGHQYSHSPSALTDEPWMIYL